MAEGACTCDDEYLEIKGLRGGGEEMELNEREHRVLSIVFSEPTTAHRFRSLKDRTASTRRYYRGS